MSIMNSTQKKSWLAALRSGEYKQGTFMLRTSDEKFCCLGVAVCAIADHKPRRGVSLLKAGRFGLSKATQKALALVNDGGSNTTAIKDKFELAGFTSYPRVSTRGRSTFGAIADWIEKNL